VIDNRSLGFCTAPSTPVLHAKAKRHGTAQARDFEGLSR
jgi:hypothetical protein